MSALLVPNVFSDELDRGYLGRVIRVNGYDKPEQLSQAINDCYQIDYSSGRRYWFEMLCKITGMTGEKFAVGHTSLPLKRGITSNDPGIPHGSFENPNLCLVNTVSKSYVAGFFCEECVRSDVEIIGVSYWRREHQIPGQFWCQQHLCALKMSIEQDVMLKLPQELIDVTPSLPEDIVNEAMNNCYVRRYLKLARLLYVRTVGIDVAKIVPALNERAKKLGYQTYPGPARLKLISDEVNKVFPKSWLEKVFPLLTKKSIDIYSSQIDGVLYMRKSSSTVTAYLLVLSVLFGDAEEAVNFLDENNKKNLVPKKFKRGLPKNLPTDQELMECYIGCKGSVVNMANTLDISRLSLQSRLDELGLPNLEGDLEGGKSPISGLYAFYIDKRSYADSFKISGMREDRFDNLLRKCASNLPRMLEKIQEPERRCSRKDYARSMKLLGKSLAENVNKNQLG
ncbi:TniQ family protein [Comamonas testosteroni]|uniref:TniQ family protein n=1 Tax=Comamonas testosteroni TaxID=285 RepID=UPI00391A0208